MGSGDQPTALLDAAVGIGRALCREAYWDRGRRLCNWMGRSSLEVSQAGGPLTPTAMALGPDLYGGSAGVALFLAELYAATDAAEFHETALAAIARSITHVDLGLGSTASPLSFFGGQLGVAYAAHRIARLTGHLALDSDIEQILSRVNEARTAHHLLDAIGGNAGAIPALLRLDAEYSKGGCAGLAIELGEELLRTAQRDSEGWSWDPKPASGEGLGERPLTGMAHGTAGFGLALLELHGATGRPEFLEGARGAFAYEDSLFDPAQGNWPDMREVESTARAKRSPRFAHAWCHGAPGIAVSRLRAIALDPVRARLHRASAQTAIETTQTALAKNLKAPSADTTICHGLTGLIEITLIAGLLLDDQALEERARLAGRDLAARHGAANRWPSGVPSGGPNPSLMLGTAGIGHVFLRLHDPRNVPSILLLTPPACKDGIAAR